jgi:hypothetical protein
MRPSEKRCQVLQKEFKAIKAEKALLEQAVRSLDAKAAKQAQREAKHKRLLERSVQSLTAEKDAAIVVSQQLQAELGDIKLKHEMFVLDIVAHSKLDYNKTESGKGGIAGEVKSFANVTTAAGASAAAGACCALRAGEACAVRDAGDVRDIACREHAGVGCAEWDMHRVHGRTQK